MAKWRVEMNAMDSEACLIEADVLRCEAGCLLFERERSYRVGEMTQYLPPSVVCAFSPSAWIRVDEVKDEG